MTRGQVWEGATKREGLLNEAMGTVGPKKKLRPHWKCLMLQVGMFGNLQEY